MSEPRNTGDQFVVLVRMMRESQKFSKSASYGKRKQHLRRAKELEQQVDNWLEGF